MPSPLAGRFPTTHVSALLALRSASVGDRQRAWSALVAAYWRPAYKHVRVRSHRSREDAEDLVQAFFTRALEKEFFADYAPDRARFRTYLRLCLDRFVANEDKARLRRKRGGGATMLELDFDAAELELSALDASIDDVFEHEWRRTMFALGIEALREHCLATGRAACFRTFERYDLSDTDERPTYEALARELGVPVTTITNHLSLARRELRRLVIEQVEQLTASHAETAAETRELFGLQPRRRA